MEDAIKESFKGGVAAGGRNTSPLVLAAAGSVLVFSLLGIAAVTGVLPSANSQKPADAARVHKMQATRPEARTVNAATCASCGTVESVRTLESKGDGSGLGAVAGGITGAVVGNQMGRGNGNTAMTLLGAAGGAFAGNEIEKNVRKRVSYRVTVRMDDGTYRTVSQSAPVTVGEKVRVVDGAIVARS